MANINRQWRKFVAVGCSHGHLADRDALAAVLKFTAAYKPQTRIHLGDFTDQAAFRSGAHGTKDETASIKDDLTSGLGFLREFRPTHLLNGNHEDRLWHLASHHNEVVARAAGSVINEICDLARKLKAVHVTEYDIGSSWLTFGDTKALHGWMYGQHALMEHAEHFGKTMMAHLHIAAIYPGRRSDNPSAWCCGTLANVPAMGYAKKRRATSRWSHGILYGAYSDTYCHIDLLRCEQNQARNWRLPL